MTETIHAWMVMPGDTLDGKTVQWDPTYTDGTQQSVRVNFTDGTSATFGKRDLVTVTSNGGRL